PAPGIGELGTGGAREEVRRPAGAPRRSARTRGRRDASARRVPAMTFAAPGLGTHITTQQGLGRLELHSGGAGLLLGMNRQNSPVTARLFRPEPTRAMLV